MRKLPPFAALRAFEATARHLSFKEAAAELGLTPTAVSHQIRQLEAESRQRLFRRKVRQVELTPRGATLAEAIEPALDAIAAAYSRLIACPCPGTRDLGSGDLEQFGLDTEEGPARVRVTIHDHGDGGLLGQQLR